MSAKTIQIYLPDGNPRGVRIADITSRTLRVVQVPRSKLKEAQQRPELSCVGVYFLFGDPEEGAKPLVYIGEAEDCCSRLKQHVSAKEFWNTAVVISAKDGSFTKVHVKYLEWYSHAVAQRVDRYRIVKGVAPAKSYVTEPMEADLLDGFDTVRVLLSTLGSPLFEELQVATSEAATLLMAGRGAEARGNLVEDGFLVLKGSTAAGSETDPNDAWVKSVRKRLVEGGVLESRDGGYQFTEDYLFCSPSTAAITVLGRRANGWTTWRDKEGRTLDELERQ